MTWTYSGDPASSPKDELRFLVQDTDVDVQLLSDEEIAYLLGKWTSITGSVLFTASMAADAVSAKFVGLTTVQADGVSVDLSKLSDKYTALAAQLRDQWRRETEAGDIDLSELMAGTQPDPTIAPLKFGMNLHDNIYAGEQDYGGEGYPLVEGRWNESGP